MVPSTDLKRNFRRRKTRLALTLRIGFLVAIPAIYLVVGTITGSLKSSVGEGDNNRNGRKLLTITENPNEEVPPEPSTIKPLPSVLTLEEMNNSLYLQQTTVFESVPIESSSQQSPISLIESTTSSSSSASSMNVTDIYDNSSTTISLEEILGRNCTKAAIFDFPPDGFTREDRQHGWIAIHTFLAIYSFILLAIVCDDYFVPAIELMCKRLKMKEDVAGATFMAAATSSPELFINCVGTFITEGDLGVGTIVGSAVFNILAVPACCGLFAGQIVDLDWWPVSRDSFMYGFAVLALIATLEDGKVMWYEALGLVSAYVLYISAMYFNDAMGNWAHASVSNCCGPSRKRSLYKQIAPEVSPLLGRKKTLENSTEEIENGTDYQNGNGNHISAGEEVEEIELASNPWNRGDAGTLWYVLKWPITFVLWLTIADCRRRPKLFVVTFFSCIMWIGATSYLVAWLITAMGDTINIPDSVMGLTFLAAGTSVPEAVSSVIVTNQGHGAMGISNSIGSNTFDILLCLGLPWLIKSTLYPVVTGNNWVVLNSAGLEYSALSLLSTLCGLYLAFALNRFRLDWRIGVTCTAMYAAFLVFASLIELNVFFRVNLPTCGR